MKNFRLQTLGVCAMALMSLTVISCNDSDDSNSTGTGTSKLMVKMTDAPGDYDEVNIEVLDVLIKSDSDEGEKGWVSVGNPDMVGEGKIYDLLKLTGGASVLLTNDLIPAGHLGQIRLLLGDQNTVVVDGETFDLDTPSAQQSGLKLKVNETLMPDITYEFLLDFLVDKSIVSAGKSGKYILKPTIKVSTQAASGIIKGSIDPAFDYDVVASVTLADGTEITAHVNDEGVFQLNGVPAGTYVVTLTPDPASGALPETITVEVANGETTNITETISFEMAPVTEPITEPVTEPVNP